MNRSNDKYELNNLSNEKKICFFLNIILLCIKKIYGFTLGWENLNN